VKKVILGLYILMSAFGSYAQSDTTYICSYGGPQNDGFNQIKLTNDKGFIAIGTTSSFGSGNTDFYVVKTDSIGRHQWSKTYGGLQNEEGFSVATTYDHGYAFLGFTNSFGAGGYDVLLVKTDSVGNIKWQKTYGGSDWDFGYSIKETQMDSGFVICGLTYSYGAGNGDVYVIKTDKSGDTLWTKAIGGAQYDIGNSVEVHSNTLYAIVGATTSFGIGDTNTYFLEVDNKGNIKKDTTFGCTHSDCAYSIRNTLDGEYFVSGSSDSMHPGTPMTDAMKIDTLGHLNWEQFNGGAGSSIGKDVVQDAVNQSYFTVGSTNTFGAGGFDFYCAQLNVGGYFIVGPTFGGANNDYGNSVTFGAGNKSIAYGGSTSSYAQGLFDGCIITQRLRNDSLLSYPIVIRQYKDTLSPSAVQEQNLPESDVKVFPNPMQSEGAILVQQQGIKGSCLFNLYDVLGHCVISEALKNIGHNQSTCNIERNNLPSGTYIYKIIEADAKIATGKLLIL